MSKKNADSNKKKFYFLENWSIFLILLFFISYTLIVYFFNLNDNYQYFVENTIGRVLHDLKSSLLSIAAIFIGIYVTVFTLLGSIRVDSIFAFLNEYTFKKLINFIKNAFIASFSYLVLIMILEIMYAEYNNIHFLFILLNASIVIYMFLTAFRFGIILYFAFSKDLVDLQKNIETERAEKNKIKELQFRIEKFLDEFEEVEKAKQNERMSKVIKKDKEI